VKRKKDQEKNKKATKDEMKGENKKGRMEGGRKMTERKDEMGLAEERERKGRR